MGLSIFMAYMRKDKTVQWAYFAYLWLGSLSISPSCGVVLSKASSPPIVLCLPEPVLRFSYCWLDYYPAAASAALLPWDHHRAFYPPGGSQVLGGIGSHLQGRHRRLAVQQLAWGKVRVWSISAQIDYFHQSFMYNDRGSEKLFSVKYIKPVGDWGFVLPLCMFSFWVPRGCHCWEVFSSWRRKFVIIWCEN